MKYKLCVHSSSRHPIRTPSRLSKPKISWRGTLCLSIIALLAMVLGLPSGATAQSNVRQARRLFEQGMQAAQLAELEEARSHFRASLELMPRPATAYNLASVLHRMGQSLHALETLDALLAGDYGEISEAERSGSEEARAEIRASLGELRLHVMSSSDIVVRVDGRVVEASRLPSSANGARNYLLRLDPGSHALTLTSAGQRFESSLDMGEGSHEDLVVDLLPSPLSDTQQDPIAPEESSSVGSSPWFWLVVGVVVVGGGVALGLALSTGDDLPSDLHFGRAAALTF